MVSAEVDDTRGTHSALLPLALPLSLVSIAGSAALAGLGGSAAIHVAGYVLGCLIPFPVVALQRRSAARLQATRGIVRPGRERVLSSLILLLGLALAGVHAWLFAWSVS